jgi:hypothetical protein
MEARLDPLQNEATSGAGRTLIVPEWFASSSVVKAHRPRIILRRAICE